MKVTEKMLDGNLFDQWLVWFKDKIENGELTPSYEWKLFLRHLHRIRKYLELPNLSTLCSPVVSNMPIQNLREIQKLGLPPMTQDEEDALVAFLERNNRALLLNREAQHQL